MYSYLTDDDHVDKKAKGTKKSMIKYSKGSGVRRAMYLHQK